MIDGIQFSELLDYTAEETGRWKASFANHPTALDLPMDIAGAGTVGKLLLHIFFVELHFSHAVLALPAADLQALPAASVSELFRISEEAAGKFRSFLASAKSEDWMATVDLGPRLSFKPTKRKLVAQALTHSLRHWAQLSTFLRQQGLKQDWSHDFLLSKAME